MITFSDLFLLMYYQVLQILTVKPYYEIELFMVKMFSQNVALENKSAKYGKMGI